MTTEKPTYDFSFIKRIDHVIYSDFNDLIEAFINNIQGSIPIILNSLFEKGFKWLLYKEGLLNTYFVDKDPNIFEMVFMQNRSSDFIRSKIEVNYNLIDKVRLIANKQKHRFSKDLILTTDDKENIVKELFSLYGQLNDLYYVGRAERPSDEYIKYICSINSYKKDIIDQIDTEIEAHLKRNDSLIQEQVNKATEELNAHKKDLEKLKKESMKEAII